MGLSLDGVSSEPPGTWNTCISSPDVESSPTVTFNVGGRIFQLAKSTIDKYPSTVLAGEWCVIIIDHQGARFLQ